jgi:hypothetical protein
MWRKITFWGLLALALALTIYGVVNGELAGTRMESGTL